MLFINLSNFYQFGIISLGCFSNENLVIEVLVRKLLFDEAKTIFIPKVCRKVDHISKYGISNRKPIPLSVNKPT